MKLKRAMYTITFATAALAASIPAFAAQHLVARHYVHKSENAGTVTQTGAVHFNGQRIEIPVTAVAPGKPDTTFEVHGKVNPTLIVPADARLRFVLANADKEMPHGLDVTVSAPPYRQMPHLPMMKTSDRGGTMSKAGAMGRFGMMKKVVAGTGIVGPNAGSRKKLALRETGWFSLKPGTYYYVCPVPGHAKQGMYGKLIVR